MAQANIFQQLLILNMLSNDFSKDVDSLRNSINFWLAISKEWIGPWTIGFGPCFFQNSPTSVDNLLAGYYNADENQYVIAIAGTNVFSAYDRDQEDADVIPVPWPNDEAPAGTIISQGMLNGVKGVLSMSSEGKSLQDYLAKKAAPSATLIFTGVSLGGTLSSTLPLFLFGTPQKRQGWKEILLYPMAGLTAGNDQFVNFYSAQFPGKKVGSEVYANWNTMLRDSLDVIPYAWKVSDLLKLPSLYGPAIPEIQSLIDQVVPSIPPIYEDIPTTSFPGTLHNKNVQNAWDYLFELMYQHGPGYMGIFWDASERATPEADHLHAFIKNRWESISRASVQGLLRSFIKKTGN